VCVCVRRQVEQKEGKGYCTPDSLAVGVARIGSKTEKMVCGTLTDLLKIDFGGPLHSLVLPGNVSGYEQEALFHYHWNKEAVLAEIQANKEAELKQSNEAYLKKKKESESRRIEQAAARLAKQQAKDEAVRARLAKMHENKADCSSSESEDDHEVVGEEEGEETDATNAPVIDNFLA
jgi:hypothetical protein